ncbi:hypothetical protein M427DRAFT_36908 [Gonapodya prolifera JEL478]|uniref:ParB/Sulfiredoxin domain-containing protein n=1 Tax=Gonapodya prolifera (strain JEL478) TaxID=1344416 RepID=A0A139A1M1_GONPJ|nr:hypothetical protein M427DRAFT_36908 [Gonapodya prolifera JEL478]|eukprot:KXS10677.1 hypothetical protein M427DRAFT_36908 [Gonapodya prolifera JEL478]
MEGNIQQLIERYRLPGNRQVALKNIRVDHGTTGISKLGFLPTSVVILIDLGNGVYGVVDGNHRLIAVFRLKDKDIPMTPYDTYVSMRRAITFTNSKGKLLTNADIVASFEGTPHVITQINSWLAIARYYCVVPNFDSILCTDSVTNRPNYRLPIGVVYAEGAVNGQLVDKNPDLAETFLRRLAALPTAAKMKEVKEMAKLWGEVYIPWINGVYDLNVSQGWTDDKKEQGRKLIIEGTFSEQHTRAEVIAELATMLEITRKGSTGGKGKEKARESSPPHDAPPSPKPRHTIPGNPSTSANLPAMDADPETFDMTVEPEEDNNARSGSESSKEETEATPKQKLTNPVAIPITHIVEPDSLEAALTAFASQQGATTSVVIINFPSPDDADKQRLALHVILLVVVTAAHILMYFAGSDTDEETPSDKDMIDDGDEGDQGAGEGGDDENLPPPQPGEPPVAAETRPTQNLTQSVHAIHQHAGRSGVVVDLQVGGGEGWVW